MCEFAILFTCKWFWCPGGEQAGSRTSTYHRTKLMISEDAFWEGMKNASLGRCFKGCVCVQASAWTWADPHAAFSSVSAHQGHPSGRAVPSSRETEPFYKVSLQKPLSFLPLPYPPSILLCAWCQSGEFCPVEEWPLEKCDCCGLGLFVHFSLFLPYSCLLVATNCSPETRTASLVCRHWS